MDRLYGHPIGESIGSVSAVGQKQTYLLRSCHVRFGLNRGQTPTITRGPICAMTSVECNRHSSSPALRSPSMMRSKSARFL